MFCGAIELKFDDGREYACHINTESIPAAYEGEKCFAEVRCKVWTETATNVRATKRFQSFNRDELFALVTKIKELASG